jgi:hypothetical protein
MSTQILEIEIFVKFFQLHLTHLQIRFWQRMKKKQHDVFIFNLCSKIKNRLANQRDKRKRRIAKTSSEKKRKWSTKLVKKMRKKNKMNEMSIKKTWRKFFRIKSQQTRNAYQTKIWCRVCKTLTKNILNKKLKLHKVLIKSKNAFVMHMRTRRIELADYLFFQRVSIVLLFDCFVIILDKRSNTCCFSASTKRRTNKACLKTMKRRIYASYWTSKRNLRRR